MTREQSNRSTYAACATVLALSALVGYSNRQAEVQRGPTPERAVEVRCWANVYDDGRDAPTGRVRVPCPPGVGR